MDNGWLFTTDFTVGYGEQAVVRSVDISLERGEILTLIGPNGAGKSTLLKSIAGQLLPLGGAVYMERLSLLTMDAKERAKKLSALFTEPVRAELLTALEVVESGRYPYTGAFGFLSEKDHQVVEQSMELVQVGSLRDRLFTQLSDGQRQRVMLARALAQEPVLLILDEPTSYLDIKYKLELLALLRKLRREKHMTMILSLHELDLAARISDRLLSIRDGHADRFGRPEEIFTPDYICELFDIKQEQCDEADWNWFLRAHTKK
jgi:iron complex transport system ATP-binding protein